MKRIVPLFLLVALSTPAIAQTALKPLENEIMQADLDFQKATAERGAEGWASFFAEQGIVTLDKPVIGPDAIRAAYKGFLSTPGLIFKWHPIRAEVMPSGTKGYTSGRYEITTPGKDGKPHTRTGSYLTVWEKQKDGSWKVIYDTGAPDNTPH